MAEWEEASPASWITKLQPIEHLQTQTDLEKTGAVGWARFLPGSPFIGRFFK